MPRYKTETIVGSDLSWLGSSHGIRNARTETIDISTFTANTHYPNGYIPSGFPIAIVSGLAVPYDVTVGTTTGAGILAGFILTDQPVAAGTTIDFAAPVLDHGRVNVTKIAAILASFVKPITAKDATTVVFV